MVTEVRAYCDLEGLVDDEDRRDLLFFLSELDGDWLRRKYAEIEQAQDKHRKEMEKKGNRRGRR
ncbi:hypothetical protein [Mesorhizobium sp. M8A.F.Ca.ET.021.01.1.1]|uniref:hypothetical protein n=1 Tax=Mesorhizobium sp. M8A.F.Ca.ET.021.01.1.1 TaxID=2496757 RepID=UPI000FCC1535|nr:hypothetical protein [Mesorhizobium sp. M8A.F.Ca.ET.021.01.1.1]RUW56743.1 hypothetical protein EOA36_02850 [Mesorhizobium sp. M8A.F.Ca.ET.021.01.1.1]